MNPKAGLQKGNPFTQPFNLVSEGLDREHLLALRVDRNEELTSCLETVCQRHNNLLVQGKRGVGKTFLMHVLHSEINKVYDDTISCYLNAMRLGFYGRDEAAIAGFPNAVLLELCTTIWKDVLQNDYSRLREAKSESPTDIKWRSHEESVVARIYTYLATALQQFRFRQERSFGAAAVVKGELKEEISKEWKAIDLLPADFFDFAEELLQEVMVPKGLARIVMICDEANLLPMREQAEILGRYVELFSARRIHFVFVVRPEVAKSIRPAFSYFEELEITGFSDVTTAKELFEKHLRGTEITINDDAITIAWEIFEGCPLDILRAGSIAYDTAIRQRVSVIDGPIMARASATHLRIIRLQESQYPIATT